MDAASPSVSLAAAPPAGRERERPQPVIDHNRIKFFWLLRLQWGAILGQTAAISVVWFLQLIHLHLPTLALLVALETVATIGAELWVRRAQAVEERHIAGAMLFDALALTVVLSFTGSYSNPFAILYVVNVALAAVLLRPVWAWAMLAASLILFGGLFVLDNYIHHGFGLSEYDHLELMRLHMQGLWVAFAIGAAFIVYIVTRVTGALSGLEEELDAERMLSARKDKVSSLATLAAGAAHELSTPLATIAVVTRELERALDRSNPPPPGAREDLGLIRQQLGRCQDILQQMAAHAGENAGESFVSFSLAQWAEAALASLPGRERVRVSGSALGTAGVEGPARGLARALRNLLKNALQASPPGEPVELRLSAAGDQVRAEVVDRGPGMSPEVVARVGEPFFTTKGPGEGMGLGLFLTRALAEQLGGQLELESTRGKGTTARLRLPAARAFQSGGAA